MKPAEIMTVEAGLCCSETQVSRQGKTLLPSEFENLPPVILERKLDAIIIDVKAVAEVNPPAKHELAPYRDARNGVV
jgi:hypothetical protein